jgi:tetratricopeptide (TPR) repeat protein
MPDRMKFIKQIPLVVLFFVIMIAESSAAEAENIFLKGNEYFRLKEYDKAIEMYETLIDEDYEGTALFYNLGNAYYKIGKLGFAILYYEKAKRLSPNDSDISHNLAIANMRTADRVEALPGFFLFQWWESLLNLFSISGWTIAAYIFYLLLLISIGYYFFAKNPLHHKIVLISGSVSLVVLILIGSLLAVKLNRELNVNSGVVVERAVNVKLSPDYSSNDAFIIHEGLKVILEDEVDGWIRIRLQDGKVGWMPKDDIRII